MMQTKKLPFLALLVSSIFFLGYGGSVKQKDVVVIWHWMNDYDDAFQQLTHKYEKETGAQVSFELYAPSIHLQKITAAAQARIFPDVFGIRNTKLFLVPFIEAAKT